jgi:hypothetical protein
MLPGLLRAHVQVLVGEPSVDDDVEQASSRAVLVDAEPITVRAHVHLAKRALFERAACRTMAGCAGRKSLHGRLRDRPCTSADVDRDGDGDRIVFFRTSDLICRGCPGLRQHRGCIRGEDGRQRDIRRRRPGTDCRMRQRTTETTSGLDDYGLDRLRSVSSVIRPWLSGTSSASVSGAITYGTSSSGSRFATTRGNRR